MLRSCLPTVAALGRLAAQGHAVRAMSAGRVVIGGEKAKRARMPRKAVMEVVRHAMPSPGCAVPPRARPPPAPPVTHSAPRTHRVADGDCRRADQRATDRATENGGVCGGARRHQVTRVQRAELHDELRERQA